MSFKEKLKTLRWRVGVFTYFIFVEVPMLFLKDLLRTTDRILGELLKPVNLAAVFTIVALLFAVKQNQVFTWVFAIFAVITVLIWVWQSGIDIHWNRKRYMAKAKERMEGKK